MLLAAVALVRSVDSGGMVLGNLAFKQEATAAADIAAERARTWILSNGALLNADSPANGYYASSQDALDPTGRLTSAANPMAVARWDTDSCACMTSTPATCSQCSHTPSNPAPLGTGATVTARYLITRLCPSIGVVDAANACAKPASTALSQASARGEIRIGSEARPTAVTMTPYYRIIVRTVGARNTVSFTETIIH
ncbi:MAG: pilus assembly protein PilX [Burkholderiaceae bacterium]|nr:pilus assembly protein PilX [Burkholderiaceae bacterium]